MESFKVGQKIKRNHPHLPDHKLALTITEVKDTHSFAETSDGDTFVIFHSSWEGLEDQLG